MNGYVGIEIEYQANFLPVKAGLIGSIGYQFKSGGVAVGGRVTTGVFENGYGSYGVKITHAEPFAGMIEWDTGDGDIKRAREEVNITVAPATLAGITADHGGGLYGAGASGEFKISGRAVVKDSVPAVPIDEVTVSLFNEDRSIRQNQKITDPMGYYSFNVTGSGDPENPTIYQLSHRKSGYSFEDDTATVSTGNVDHVCEGVPFVVPMLSDNPAVQTIWGYTYDSQGAAADGVVVEAELRSRVDHINHDLLIKLQSSTISANGGAWALPVVIGADYTIIIGEKIRKPIKVVNVASKPLTGEGGYYL